AAACTGGSGEPNDPPPPDGAVLPDGNTTPDGNPPPNPDAPPGTMATVVPCPAAGADADVWYYDGIGYIGGSATIPLGGTVRFHDLGTHTADHVNGLWSASGDAELCVRFDGAGGYAFRCYFHAEETGTITVTAPN
ncbi:MAG TPA: hypothetical protein VM513_00500, partial [Kofleriaceae bacterium]|nr:hypothetical protein [Kofleriaceae bacterium]